MMGGMRTFAFAKGHAAMNDFVLIKDRHATLSLSDEDVRWICDRRAGLGADGVLRAVKAGHMPGWTGDPNLWFMDHRNADGSAATMCGNGLRLFVRYLIEEDLAPRNEVLVATRAGQRTVWELFDGRLRATMGKVSVDGAPTGVTLGDREYAATGVDVGNSHAVVLLGDAEALADLDLTQPVSVSPGRFPDGANVVFAVPTAPGRLTVRVVERGVGETLACGTGAVAASAVAARAATCEVLGDYAVRARGGRLDVRLSPDQSYLTGPAVVVARGEAVLPE